MTEQQLVVDMWKQNHRGAMVELGEGLTKLRRADFQEGPLHDFEREASAVLEFIYNAQLEHAACEFTHFCHFSSQNILLGVFKTLRIAKLVLCLEHLI